MSKHDKKISDDATHKLQELGKKLRFAYEHIDELDLSPKVKEALRAQFEAGQAIQNADGTYFCPTCGDSFEIEDVLPIAQAEKIAKKNLNRINVACPHCQVKLPPEFATLASEYVKKH